MKVKDQKVDVDINFEIRLNNNASLNDSQDSYDEIYSVDDISQTESFYIWISKIIKLEKGERFLDVSCGRAQIVDRLSVGDNFASGIDLSHVALKSRKVQNNLIPLCTANSQDLPFVSSSFDVVSNIGSIEHYQDMDQAIREMARILKPSGRAIILVPNSFSLLHNVLSAYNSGRTVVDNQPIQRYAARAEWEDLLSENGLKVVEVDRYEIEFPLTRQDWVSYLKHPKKLVRLIVRPFVPLNLSFCFVFTCQKM
ncbi:MAG: class I SAM-dependent methyltransferase [Chloroflexota bacterium]